MHEGVKRIAHVISTIVDPIHIGCLTLLILNTLVRGHILRALGDTSILLVCLVPGIVYRIRARTYDNAIYKVYTMCILLAGVGTTSVIYTLNGAEAPQIRSLYIGS